MGRILQPNGCRASAGLLLGVRVPSPAKFRRVFAEDGLYVALEFQSREGYITDPNNDSQGKQFTSKVMEAGYTQLLQVLHMMIELQNT